MKIKFPSLELKWLKLPKDIPLPKIITTTKLNFSGIYYEPEPKEIQIYNKFYSLDKGIILIKEGALYPSTLAHEVMHHLQFLRQEDFDTKPISQEKPYKDSIIEYFKNSKTEREALLYEVEKYPDDVNQEWLEWLIKKNQIERKYL